MEGIMKKVLVLVLLVLVIISSSISAERLEPLYHHRYKNVDFSLDEGTGEILVWFYYLIPEGGYLKIELLDESIPIQILKEAFFLEKEELSLVEKSLIHWNKDIMTIEFTFKLDRISLNRILK